MKYLKKLTAYLPFLSAAVVIACIGGSLSGYVEPVYQVEAAEETQVDTEAVEESETEETEEIELVQGNFDLEDGIYYGSGTGYSGTVKVAVEIQSQSITAITILSSEDDEAFFNRAKGVIDLIIEGQTLDVDVISGATYSSNGIINAVKNALTGEEDTSTAVASSSTGSSGVGSTSVSTVDESDAVYKDGTYYGTGTGFAGTIKVKVVISDDKISSISIVSHSDGSSYISKASAVIDRIISSQSTNVDTVSGATYSSVGIINAVRDALEDARVTSSDGDDSSGSNDNDGDDDNENNETNGDSTVTGTVPYNEGIYYGTGEGYMGDITLAVVIQDQTIKAILILETEDDEAFLARAKTILTDVLKYQTIEGIDVVSGATYSSEGILEALAEAMQAAYDATYGAEEEPESETDTESESETETGSGDESDGNETETESGNGSDSETETGSGDDSDSDSDTEEKLSVYVNGSYNVTVVCEPDDDGDFDAYNLSMTVTIENDKITAITNISGDGDESNTAYITRAANGTSKITGVVAQITAKGLPEGIDTVSRATCSSNAIIEACEKALEAALRTTGGNE